MKSKLQATPASPRLLLVSRSCHKDMLRLPWCQGVRGEPKLTPADGGPMREPC